MNKPRIFSNRQFKVVAIAIVMVTLVIVIINVFTPFSLILWQV